MLLTLLSTLAINAAITGSSTLTFTPSGSLVTDGALTGGSTLTFTPSGSLTTDALISGGTSLTFALAGGLTTSAEMSGVTSITFTTTGDLLTEAQLSGSQTLTFITSGDLTGGNIVEPPSGVNRGDDGGFRRYPVYVPEIPEIEEIIQAEVKRDRPKTRKIKREIAEQVIELAGNGILANRPIPASIYARVEQALFEPDKGYIYIALQLALERAARIAQDIDDDDEEAIMMLFAA